MSTAKKVNAQLKRQIEMLEAYSDRSKAVFNDLKRILTEVIEWRVVDPKQTKALSSLKSNGYFWGGPVLYNKKYGVVINYEANCCIIEKDKGNVFIPLNDLQRTELKKCRLIQSLSISRTDIEKLCRIQGLLINPDNKPNELLLKCNAEM